MINKIKENIEEAAKWTKKAKDCFRLYEGEDGVEICPVCGIKPEEVVESLTQYTISLLEEQNKELEERIRKAPIYVKLGKSAEIILEQIKENKETIKALKNK